MKNLLLLLVFCAAELAYAVDSGSYVWSAAGCRDSSLDPASHVVKFIPSTSSEVRRNPDLDSSWNVWQSGNQVIALTLHIHYDGTASITIFVNNYLNYSSAVYSAREDTIVFSNNTHRELISFHIVEDTLVFIADDAAFDEVCESDQVYVYVLQKVEL